MSSKSDEINAIDILSRPLTLPCGLTLPNRLVKCPMQETLAIPPFFDPPVDKFRNLYTKWANAGYGLLITGQVQVDIRFLSIKGDVVCHQASLEDPTFSKWKSSAKLAKSGGTLFIGQLAHPGRMSPMGAGNQPSDMPTHCPSSVPVELGNTWLDKMVRLGGSAVEVAADIFFNLQALNAMLGTPREMSLSDIDAVVADFKRGAELAKEAGFDGCQLHGAYGLLLSQFLSPRMNRRNDEYGGSPEKTAPLPPTRGH